MRPRRLTSVLVTVFIPLMVILSILMAAPAPGQEVDDLRGLLPPDELLRPEALLGALISIEVDRQIEADALVIELDRLNRLRSRRDQALDVLASLYADLDLVFNTAEGRDRPDEMEALEESLRMAELRVQMLGDEGRDLRQRIESRRSRLLALIERTDQLIATLPDDTDSITGVWDVRFVPTGEHGVFTLFQSGTVLNGEYALSGGWHGSLQGTVVGGKMFLERIDAVKGRFSTLTGELNAAGTAVRGTWTERDLTANRPTDGSWLAETRQRDSAGR
jgi:hypothetical protein